MFDAIRRAFSSSTLVSSVVLPLFQLVAQHAGFGIPWSVITTGIAAFGVKEAAGKIGSALATPSPSAGTGTP